MKILLVEDDVQLVEAIQTVFRDTCTCDVAGGEREALLRLTQNDYSLLIVDHVLDDGSGLSFIKELRKTHARIPVLVMTAHASKDLAIACVNLGVQRFLEKPFTIGYLKSEIQSLAATDRSIMMGPRLYLRLDRRRVEVDGEEVPLTPIEYRIIEFLVLKQGECVSRGEITKAIWDKAQVSLNTLDTHLSSIRQKAPELGQRVRVSRGRGYWWEFGA